MSEVLDEVVKVECVNSEELHTINSEKDKSKKEVNKVKASKNKPKKETYMTWGKYRGKTVKEVIDFDEKYAKWLYRQEFVKKFDDIYAVLHNHFN